jgi:cobyrinic acid a,c-diamide synthase
VLGCQHLDPDLSLRGVILNNVSGPRHEQILRAAIESTCSIPILGALPRLAANPFPERHLGLVPPQESCHGDRQQEELLRLVENHLDADGLIAIARSAAPLAAAPQNQPRLPDARDLKIGYMHDSAFSFYYPENLEELQRAGADLVPVSALGPMPLPDNIHALYIGGGFPETHASELARNAIFLAALRRAAECGLPIYAECGGLMLLARSLSWKNVRYLMAGVLPIDVQVFERPQGHGYCELAVDARNPFFMPGTRLRGHEFHYSRIVSGADSVATAAAVMRGTGCFEGREFLVANNVMVSYAHLHAAATPDWTRGMIGAARAFAARMQPQTA